MKSKNPSQGQYLGLVSAIKNGNTSLAISILDSIKDHPETLKAVLTANYYGYEGTPLHFALYNNNTNMANWILDSIKDHPETLKAVLTAKR